VGSLGGGVAPPGFPDSYAVAHSTLGATNPPTSQPGPVPSTRIQATPAVAIHPFNRSLHPGFEPQVSSCCSKLVSSAVTSRPGTMPFVPPKESTCPPVTRVGNGWNQTAVNDGSCAHAVALPRKAMSKAMRLMRGMHCHARASSAPPHLPDFRGDRPAWERPRSES